MAEAKANAGGPCAVLSGTGTKMPLLGLGTWNCLKEEGRDGFVAAIKAGYRHLDGAWIYQNEKELGEAIKICIDEGVVKREDLFVTSKLWIHSSHPEDVEKGCRESLALLGLDYVDLYLVHWPFSSKRGEVLPLDDNGKLIGDEHNYLDAWPQMEALFEKGLTKNIGVCNLNVKQLEALKAKAKIQPNVLQVESQPYLPQLELIKYCKDNNMLMTAYCPLASPGTVKDEAKNLLTNAVVQEVAKKYGKTAVNVLCRFQMDRGVSVIPKSTNPKRLAENYNCFDFKLAEEDIKKLEGLSNGFRAYPFPYGTNNKDYPF